jgi:hypothetical protein
MQTQRNIPIHAIGLSLYEALPGTSAEQIGQEVIRTQWLCVSAQRMKRRARADGAVRRGEDAGKKLLGRRVLVVVCLLPQSSTVVSKQGLGRTRSTTPARLSSSSPSPPPPDDPLTRARRYAIAELQADVERELLTLPEGERDAQRTRFAIFVVHNKRKPKLGVLPADVPCARAVLVCCTGSDRARTQVLCGARDRRHLVRAPTHTCSRAPC